MNITGLNLPRPSLYSGLGHPSSPGTGTGAGGEGRTQLHRGLRFNWREAGRACRLASLAGGQRGSILLETVIASTVFAMVGVAVLSGLNMIYTHGARVEVQSTAENVVRNQLEDVFSQPYLEPPNPYLTSVGVPVGYTVTVTTTDMPAPDPNIERLTVAVSHEGVPVMSVETIRFNKP